MFAPPEAAVCVVTAGKFVENIDLICRSAGWTYLSVSKNKTGLALNKAIQLHPAAKWIFKMDEDIFVSKNFFKSLRKGYDDIASEGEYNPGFCAPTINVNGVTYVSFLKHLGLSEDYVRDFGELKVACNGVRAQADPSAAVWLWRRSLPLDKKAAEFSNELTVKSNFAQMIGTRFSIGAILMERSFFDEIGGFRSAWRQGILGVDEEALCAACINFSRPMFYLSNVFAGHFSFFMQESAMMDALPELSVLDPSVFVMPGEFSK
jgi:hypothetical protein